MGSRHSREASLIESYIPIEESVNSPSSVSDLLSFEQGLGINGQPGLFQTLSIRGLARQRVHAYVDGMRVTSERRAGVSASFIDPLLLSGAEVTQGPASTYYGSGAIGGSIHLLSRQAHSPWLQSSFSSDGNETAIAAGFGNDTHSGGAAFRTRNNGETEQGEEKNNEFSQHSIIYKRHIKLDHYELDWQIIESQGRDIGKDNLRFLQNRITNYPEENHLLMQLTLASDSDWLIKGYFHKQDLQTEDIRTDESYTLVETDSLDIGLSYENLWHLGESHGLIGIDYFGRRGVESFEQQNDLLTLENIQFFSLKNAQENEAALFATLNREFDFISFSSGLRTNYQSQRSAQTTEVSDNFLTYFVGLKTNFEGLNFSLNYGNGFRFASITERLFNGTTGRGQSQGNPLLMPEESTAIDFGIDYQQEKYQISAHLFKTKIDDFIERVSIAEDLRSFENLTNGELNGWQYQLRYLPLDSLEIEISGQGINGENEFGDALSDIPPDRHQLRAKYSADKWSTQLSYTRRLEKTEAGDGEVPLSAANFAEINFAYQIRADMKLKVGVRNFFDQSYFDSSDDLATLSSGRAVTLTFSYQ
ncbi:MAG: outer membrane receptor protein involved in Fe transport [Paraglaciecola sp.]|jgi:outer membrane receptor protein involved in Fe transport